MTKTRDRFKSSNKPQGHVVPEPERIFTPVHAASMSTPIYAQLAAQLGEPDLNPYEEVEISFAQELADLHAPDLSMRQHVPAWALHTGEYLAGRVALAEWADRMQEDEEVVNGQEGSQVHGTGFGAEGTG